MSVRNRKSLMVGVPAAAAVFSLLFTGSSQAAPAAVAVESAPAGVVVEDSAPAVAAPGSGRPTAATGRAAAPLRAPTQTSPPSGVVFDHYPRTTTVTWRAVPGAIAYMVHAQSCDPRGCSTSADELLFERVPTAAHTFGFAGKQPGRWRVWAVDSSGAGGYASGWFNFRYTI